MTRVPRPRVVFVQRRNPGHATPGDLARVQLKPGLIALLEPLDSGFEARYSVPVGLAPTAALAILEPASKDISWAGRDLEIEWTGSAAPDDTILVEARLEHLSIRKSRFAIAAKTQAGTSLYKGTLSLTAIQDGRPFGFRSHADYDAVRVSIGAARKPRPPASGCLKLVTAPRSIPLGQSAFVEVEIRNAAEDPRCVTVEWHAPFGSGLSFDVSSAQSLQLDAGQTCRVGLTIRADRPHEVNLGNPWPLEISAANEILCVTIAVPDPNPGRTFYLLTEDCETFDGGPLTGAYAGMENFGNHNNFMDPEDYRIQMIEKPNRLNQIAERHGARWTHFFAATQRFAAEWAAKQSATGQWSKVVADMDAAIREGSAEHEYAPHIHFDYEPDSMLPPQPRLVYAPKVDGILPNDYYDPETNPTHRYHDWDGSARGTPYIKLLGDWAMLDTKAGSLRKSVHYLTQLAANRRSVIVGRTGSHDFGKSPEDQATSTCAYLANGLFGNSDAYDPGSAPHAGGQMFWCSKHDRGLPVENLRDAGLVQLRIIKDTGFASAEDMNDWFRATRESCRGPGVHSILFTSHAMFLAGEPDPFRSLGGGSFDRLDSHLEWVRKNHPDVEFATASEAVLEFLDYYTPTVAAHTESFLCGGDPGSGVYEFEVRLLGRGIRVDAEHPASVRIAAPLCFSPEELTDLHVKQRDTVIAATQYFDAAKHPSLTVVLDNREPLRLGLRVRPEAIDRVRAWFLRDDELPFRDPVDALRPDLLQLRPPVVQQDRIRFSGDLIQLLMNPVAGNADPLGRRIHPLGCLAVGAALTAAFNATASTTPARLRLHWAHPLPSGSGFSSKIEATDRGILFRLEDDNGTDLAEGEVTMQIPDAPPVSAPRVDSLHPGATIAGVRFQVHRDQSHLAILGTDFVSGAVVLLDGQAVPTTFGNSGFLSASVNDVLLSTPGTLSLRVQNPDGQQSNELSLRILTARDVPDAPSTT